MASLPSARGFLEQATGLRFEVLESYLHTHMDLVCFEGRLFYGEINLAARIGCLPSAIDRLFSGKSCSHAFGDVPISLFDRCKFLQLSIGLSAEGI